MVCFKYINVNTLHTGDNKDDDDDDDDNNNNNNNNDNKGTSIITDATVDFNRPNTVFINRKNKKELVTDTALPLTHNLSSTDT